MKIFVTVVALVAAVNAQAVVPVMQQNQLLTPGQLPVEYGPPLPVQPLTPFNAALDGYYGYNPYLNPYNAAFFPQAPFLQPAAFNNINPLAYQSSVAPVAPVPNPYAFPAAFPQLPLYPGQLPQLPQGPFPAQFPGGPNPTFAARQQLGPQMVQQQPQRPFSPAPSVSFSSFQLQHPTSQPVKSTPAASQGVNGAPKPVSSPHASSNTGNQAYGSAFGKYVSAVPSNSNSNNNNNVGVAQAVPQQPGTVLTAPLLTPDGRGVNQPGAQGVNVAQ